MVADRGYFKGEKIPACTQTSIDVIAPKNLTANAYTESRFGKADFIYDDRANEYQCPAGEKLIWRFTSKEKGMNLYCYWMLELPAVFTQIRIYAKSTTTPDTMEA